MSSHNSTYREHLIQWIWENRKFRQTGLSLIDGSALKIIDTGVLNHGSGPDFTSAKLRINDLLLYGNIEIHTDEEHWFAHSHNLDSNYNSVILHVVFNLSKSGRRALRKDGSEPLTFHLAPAIEKPLHQLLTNSRKQGIECSGNISFINQEVFYQQIQKAKKEYFSFKAGQLMEYYDPGETPSDAWKKMLIISLYDHFGIPRNRKPMAELAKMIVDDTNFQLPRSVIEFITYTEDIAFSKQSKKIWVSSGMRPSSRPEKRIRQAAALHHQIVQTPMDKILGQGTSLWHEWRKSLANQLRCGSQTDNLLKYTVFYPSLFVLGKLFFSNTLVQSSFNAWKQGTIRIPSSIKQEFEKAGFETDKISGNAGLIHQYKRYCLEQRCMECKLFKKAFHS